jgi:DNA-binding MarR family transcriptional regulator
MRQYGSMQKRRTGAHLDRFLDAWFRVRQLIQAANFNRFQSAGLSATQFMTLNVLPDDEHGIAIGELARQMNLAPSTVAKTVDSLQARKLVARVRSAQDGRLVLLRITAQGRRLQNTAAGQFRDQIGGIFAAMSPQERRGLVDGLEALLRIGSPQNAATEVATPRADGAALGTAVRAARSARRSRPR